MDVLRPAHFPGRALIDAYGNGGFRFAEMSHRGSILCLPDGVFGWDAPAPDQLAPYHLRQALETLSAPAFLLLGTGSQQIFPAPDLAAAFADAGLGLEAMSTGAACRTYNVLLGEGRPVAAALIATD